MKQTSLTGIAGPETVVLAGLCTSVHDPVLFELDIQEMQMLCTTAGAQIVQTIIQNRVTPEASTYLGSGKLLEIKAIMDEHQCKTLIIDAELTPGQIRNIEKAVEGKVIDRSQLILDIFIKHARTNEAKIQVELAQLRTLYPRLAHASSHYSQQVGGIGTTGPGEKQLELDRRLIQKRISDLKQRLEEIDQNRSTQRKSRQAQTNIALVGYTNVGKSSLLNALCSADVLVANRLFATLETATRRTFIPGCGEITISDTVGFLRKLPHHLVASFKSTLSVVREANLLLLVLDGSGLHARTQLDTVEEVLGELGAAEVPRLYLLNKMDLVQDALVRSELLRTFPDAMLISAHSKEDMKQLKKQIGSRLNGLGHTLSY